MTESFPLQWPSRQKRTEKYLRKEARFNTTMGRARDELIRQLKLLYASNVVISSNVATYKRGGKEIMYADQNAAKEDSGVAIYYTWQNEQYCLACDKWKSVTDNLQALNKTVEAIRGIERWGTSEMMKEAFLGFKQLPEPYKVENWWEVLGIHELASITEIKERYRKLAMVHHPDRGGKAEMFNRIHIAYMKGITKDK